MRARNPVLISPSLLSADFAMLADGARACLDAGADWLHCDVMDGVFVPNISFGQATVRALRSYFPDSFLDVHLMIADPARYAGEFIDAGASLVCVHAEACTHLHRALRAIRGGGAAAGVALNPATGLDAVDYALEDADMVLCMSVDPGFGGQSLIPSVYRKVETLAETIAKRGLKTRIQVDGGVTAENAARLRDAGADTLVAGSAVFGADDMAAAIRAIRGA